MSTFKTYQLAQKVNVNVLKVDILKNQIDLELVKNEQDEHINNKKSSDEISTDIQD